jgi:hypothetical protein
MWSVGCIFAELMGRRPIFPGKNYKHQIELICNVLGTPNVEDLKSVTSQKALQFLQALKVSVMSRWFRCGDLGGGIQGREMESAE